MHYGLSIDMLFKHIRTVSLNKNHLFFRLSKSNYYAVTSLKRAFPSVSRLVECRHEFVPG